MKKSHPETGVDRALRERRIGELWVERAWCLPGEPGKVIWALRAVIALLIRVMLRLYTRFEIVGHENIRTNRSLVIVANHSSHLDAVCLLAALPIRKLRRAFSAAAEDYFFRSLSRRWIASVVVNALPFARQHHVRESLAVCRELLANTGNILIVFPEGTRSANGEIHEFKPGVGALVAGREVSVLPCYLEGTSRVWPKGKCLPRPHKVRLIIGQPRQYSSSTLNRAEITAIASELRDAVAALKIKHATH
jgi:1-acyl-sn-glycerol-3-phosphate acyltransferase